MPAQHKTKRPEEQGVSSVSGRRAPILTSVKVPEEPGPGLHAPDHLVPSPPLWSITGFDFPGHGDIWTDMKKRRGRLKTQEPKEAAP